jgi:P27 family predicted phage terminase small subunit
MKAQPPRHLSQPARAWFGKLRAEYGIEDSGGLALLTTAAEAWDRARDARILLAKEGAVVRDRFGQQVAHPAVRIENAARAQMLQALKQLALDVEPVKRPGRPGIGGYRGAA